jgi:hypothetical protein
MPKHYPDTIGKVVCDNLDFLRVLAKTKSIRKRKRILKNATPDQLLALAEISLNICNGRFPITTRQKRRLLPFASFVRRMARFRSQRGAHKFIVQKGGALPINLFTALLTPIILKLSQSLLPINK